jgi:hypothetical protein
MSFTAEERELKFRLSIKLGAKNGSGSLDRQPLDRQSLDRQPLDRQISF